MTKDEERFARAVNRDLHSVRPLQGNATQEEIRKEMIDIILEGICRHCGSDTRDQVCHCTNDE